MVKIEFPNENINILVKRGTLLLDAIREAKLDIETPCNGAGFCGKCKVIAKGELSSPSEEELKIIDVENHERLSCMTRVLGDIEVNLLGNRQNIKTINRGYAKDVLVDSHIKLVKLPDINKNSSIPYANYIGYEIDCLNIYLKLSNIEENNITGLWGIVFEGKFLDICEYTTKILGVAIDIGTTGISYCLVDLINGEVLNNLSSLNPQTQYGGDVLTRITYCLEEPLGIHKLQQLVVSEINNSIKELIGDVYGINDIYHISISANTTMAHLLLGIKPISIAKAPYRPIFLNLSNLKAKEAGIIANINGLLSIIPAASSFIGGDVVAGIIASDFKERKQALFVDIGTNGEMAVSHEDKVIAASTAAGPAFEGMNIECGCRAGKGAIETFTMDENYNIGYSTIGNEKPIGICGSGLIDIVGALVKRNVILQSGRWNRELDSNVGDRLVDKKFYITDDIYVSQKDIRQIQLAKSAIASGIILMLEELNLKIDEITQIYIAGAFGYHINPINIKEIGIIPKGFKGEITFLGNMSLEGARLLLINKMCSENIINLNKSMGISELSLKKNFQDVFVSQLNF